MNIFKYATEKNLKNIETDSENIFDSVIEDLNKKREKDCNKGTFGTLGCICGCYGMAGAAMLCGSAAINSGSGIVKMILPKSIYPIAAANLWEAVYLPMEENENGALSKDCVLKLTEAANGCSAIVMGCGLSVCDDTQKAVETVLSDCTKPIILDADGINCLSRNINVLSKRTAPTILTPHPGEMSRLCNMSIKEVQANRQKLAENFADSYNCILVLKGTGTIITDGKNTVINTTGNGCLAKGGSGDVLAGIIGALVCQGIDLFDAAAAGVYLHGYAADECSDKYSMSSVTARDVIKAIKYLM